MDERMVTTKEVKVKHRKLPLGLGVAAALVGTSLAIAAQPSPGATEAAAAFRAEVKRAARHACADGAYHVSRMVLTGQSESRDPRLNGRLHMTLRAVYDNGDKLGHATGRIQIRGSERKVGMNGHFSATVADEQLEGMILGHARRPQSRLVANFTAKLDGGVLSGKLGTGEGANTALFFKAGCRKDSDEEPEEERPEKPERPAKPERP